MYRRFSVLSGVLGIAFLLAARLDAQQAGARVAFINARAVLLETPGFAQAESTYTRELAGFRGEIEKLQASLDSAASDFEQKSVMLSATAKTAKRRELEAQQQQLEQRATELRTKAGQREQELLSPIHSRVNDVIEQIRSAGGFSMIFDVSANSGLIVAVDKSLDLTSQVIEKLKSSP